MAWQVGWRGVELRHLVALQAVAEERSFSAAAAKLGYTQSAISGQILALERAIGARLVERVRGSRPVRLTPEGEILLAHAAAITGRLNSAQVEIASLGGARRALRVGTFQTVARTLVPEAFRRLHAEDADAELELHESHNADDLLDALERGTLDVAFTVLPTRTDAFEAVELYRDELVVVCARTHPLARVCTVSLADLEALPVIVVEKSALPQVRRLENVASMLDFVATGLGVGLIPSLAVPDLPPELVVVPVATPPRAIGLAWSADREPPPRAARFVELASAVGRTLRRPLLRAS
jgi:DNA-binding transcriptional LysR family regulator